jgi:hypothetical protein
MVFAPALEASLSSGAPNEVSGQIYPDGWRFRYVRPQPRVGAVAGQL